MRIFFRPALFLAALPAASGLAADAPDLRQSAQRAGAAQETMRADAAEVQKKLAALVEEFRASGLSDADAPGLDGMVSQLDGLTGGEMRAVVETLKAAASAGKTRAQRSGLLSAYEEQKTIAVRLKSLAAGLRASESLPGLPAQMQELLRRQVENARVAAALTATGATTPDQLPPALRDTQRLAKSEQAATADEAALLARTLADLAAAPDPNGELAAVKAALAGAPQLRERAAAAKKAQDGSLAEAAAAQAALRDSLAEALRAWNSAENPAESIARMEKELDSLLADQTALASGTPPTAQNAEQADRQRRLKDRTEMAEALLQPLNAAAAERLRAARGSMEEALNTPDAAASTRAGQTAAQALDDTRKMLREQLAQLNSPTPPDAAQQRLAQLQGAVRDMQLAALANPAPEQAKQLADQAAALQRAALPLSPAAAQKLGDAAQRLGEQPSEAVFALADAADELQKTVAALQQSEQQLQALRQTQQKLDEARRLAVEAQDNLRKNGFNAAAAKLNAAGQKLADAAVPSAPPAGPSALGQAREAFQQGAQGAAQSRAADAQQSAERGLQALDQAQAALNSSMQALQARSRPSGPAPASTGQSPSSGLTAAAQPGAQTGKMAGSGPGEVASGSAMVVAGLKTKDREAINMTENEKVPAEYVPMVQQYLKNLSDRAQ